MADFLDEDLEFEVDLYEEFEDPYKDPPYFEEEDDEVVSEGEVISLVIDLLSEGQKRAFELSEKDNFFEFSVWFTAELTDAVLGDPSRFVLELSEEGSTLMSMEFSLDSVINYLATEDENLLVVALDFMNEL